MTASSPGPEVGQAAPGGETPPNTDDPDADEDVNVLALAGQIPSQDGEWLLVTTLDGRPGARFLARHLRPDELHARGSDVLIRLLPDSWRPGLPQIRAQVLVALGGRLILAGNWDRQDIGRWPEQIRPTAAFAMGMVTELEENGADLGARHRVQLDAPETVAAGVPLGITWGRAIASQPGG
jgi:hypothetical protein